MRELAPFFTTRCYFGNFAVGIVRSTNDRDRIIPFCWMFLSVDTPLYHILQTSTYTYVIRPIYARCKEIHRNARVEFRLHIARVGSILFLFLRSIIAYTQCKSIYGLFRTVFANSRWKSNPKIKMKRCIHATGLQNASIQQRYNIETDRSLISYLVVLRIKLFLLYR